MPLGVLGIFFDWEPQAQNVVESVRWHEDERDECRCLLLDNDHRVIAASDGVGLLTEHFPLETGGRSYGYYEEDGRIIAFSRTQGYETYRGLGWYGVIVQG